MSALRFGVERYYVYEFQAPEKIETDQKSHFDILHCDWSPKPAFHAYKTLIGLRPAGSMELDCGSRAAARHIARDRRAGVFTVRARGGFLLGVRPPFRNLINAAFISN